jgi:hypothetical protein
VAHARSACLESTKPRFNPRTRKKKRKKEGREGGREGGRKEGKEERADTGGQPFSLLYMVS